ncbi:MAG: transglycosylase domain-containing protein, partial [Clostridia bacterium]|nr:transglycosylase domain-containing protein [Clostridia bacterium]
MGKTKKRLLIAAAVIASVLLALALAFFLVFDVANWQRLDTNRLHGLAQTSSLYDMNGDLMSEVRGTENRTVISLSEVPMHTQMAFIAAEDLRFFDHSGIDIY